MIGRTLLAVATAVALGGCMASGSGGLYVEPGVVVIEEAPPPPRVEHYEVQAGSVWVTGRWYRDSGRWAWRDGHRETSRAGYVYAPGNWQRRGRGHVYVDGSWRASGSATVRSSNRRR